MEFFKEKLGSAKYFLAPMVDQSELAWRLLGRQHGAQVTYTPMIHSRLFVENEHYRKEHMQFDENDRPIIAQFCANDPQVFVQAVILIQDHCDAIDLNLGCPQGIAKKGHYGAFLQNDWDLVRNLLQEAVNISRVPITAKIRIFPELNKSLEYAKMIESTGVKLLAVHGRTIEQKAQLTGLADWDQIKAIKRELNIPVVANGNIQYFDDIEKCIQYTGVDAVMSAEGHLHNPAIFTGIPLNVYDACHQYLEICTSISTANSAIKGHVFKLLHHALSMHSVFRSSLSSCIIVEDFKQAVSSIEVECKRICQAKSWSPEIEPVQISQPHWFCQPYVREASINEHFVSELKHEDSNVSNRRQERRVRKTLAKEAKLKAIKQGKLDISKGRLAKMCITCFTNNKSFECNNSMCKACCREQPISCQRHKKVSST